MHPSDPFDVLQDENPFNVPEPVVQPSGPPFSDLEDIKGTTAYAYYNQDTNVENPFSAPQTAAQPSVPPFSDLEESAKGTTLPSYDYYRQNSSTDHNGSESGSPPVFKTSSLHESHYPDPPFNAVDEQPSTKNQTNSNGVSESVRHSSSPKIPKRTESPSFLGSARQAWQVQDEVVEPVLTSKVPESRQSDEYWISVDEVKLVTEPTTGPPPSRRPPLPGQRSSGLNRKIAGFNLDSSIKESSSRHESPQSNRFSKGASESSNIGTTDKSSNPFDDFEQFVSGVSRARKETKMDMSAPTLDEEMIENSTAASASTIAMKEAVERARSKALEREKDKDSGSKADEAQVYSKDTKEDEEEEASEAEERLKAQEREEKEKEKKAIREKEERERRRREREKEREKDRIALERAAVDRANKEARERAAAEVRQRLAAERAAAERAAVERVTAEARERAAAEARERAAAEAKEKAERAAVERAAAEAKERAERAAAERAVAERAVAEARERAAAEARERAANEAKVRAAAEARERAAAEAREKAERAAAERAAAEARERAAAERAASEARARAERAFVDRVTAEARKRAAEKAAAEAREKAAAEARDKAAAERAAREQQRKTGDDLEAFFASTSRPASNPKQRSPARGAASDVRQPNKGFSTEGSQRNSNAANSSRRVTQASPTDDWTSLFGPSVSASGEFQEVEGESAERRKARWERYQRTAERTAKALDEKNQRDLQLQREQAERHRAGEMLDAEIKRWAAGKEGNLRALLSTLQYVLWPECGWQPVSLTDLITAAAVKKVYRKATLCVHPDKVQQKGATVQQKYIAEKVFDLLKEAWNKFNSEELF
ncbi:hypothetical protein KP509_22G030600 [Ceratopteris richardii]|nr:hypothetical protein KP509_22G030600 [Ceratopteris richardii]